MSLVTSVDDKKKVIFNFDLQPIINKLVRVHKWTKEDVLACETLYRNFLYLNFAYGDKYKIAPTHEVDLFWHEHILDTKNILKIVILYLVMYCIIIHMLVWMDLKSMKVDSRKFSKRHKSYTTLNSDIICIK